MSGFFVGITGNTGAHPLDVWLRQSEAGDYQSFCRSKGNTVKFQDYMGDSECERKHGAGVQALGAYIDGLPAGTEITLDDLVRVSGLEPKSVTNIMPRFKNATVWVDPEDGSMYRMALDLNPAPTGEVKSSFRSSGSNPILPGAARHSNPARHAP